MGAPFFYSKDVFAWIYYIAPYWPEDADLRFQYSLSGHSMGVYYLWSYATESNPAVRAAVGLDQGLTSPGA